MDLFFVLLVLLVLTRTFGELAVRVGQPSLVGELIAGIVLGAVVSWHRDWFPDLASIEGSAIFNAITDLGMFFIMLFAGIEMQPHKIMRYSSGAFVTALGGMAVPLVLGIGLGVVMLPENPWRDAQALFLGTALAITAVPATVRILLDLGKLNSRSGQIIVSAAVFDDVMSLLVLAWLTGMIGVGETPGVRESAILGGKVLLFFAVTIGVGRYLYPIFGGMLKRLNRKELEMEFSALLVAAFAFAVLAEALDLHFILGAFVAGVFFGRRTINKRIYTTVRSKVSGMTFGFLAPLFFASIGLNLDMSAFTEVPVFLLAFLVLAFLGKFVGAGAAALVFGLSPRESAAVGVGMSARGAVELVIADIALRAGLFNVPGHSEPILTHIFSAVVIMAVVTTLVTPILLKRVYRCDSIESQERETGP